LKNESLNTQIMAQATLDSVRKLDPRWMVKNPVMFVSSRQRAHHGAVDCRRSPCFHRFGFNLQITLWLWFTVLFANFAEAMAEGRGKAQPTRCARPRARPLPSAIRPTAALKKW